MAARPEVTGRRRLARPMNAEKSPPAPDQLTWVDLQRILSLNEVEELTSLSHDSLKRHHADKIVSLSPRRVGMKLGDALAIANGEYARETGGPPNAKPSGAAPACKSRRRY
jgi:hypothetical protein